MNQPSYELLNIDDWGGVGNMIYIDLFLNVFFIIKALYVPTFPHQGKTGSDI